MHHEVRAGAAVGVVIGVRVAKVKGEIVVGVRIHLGRADRVEALRSLAVAFFCFGPSWPDQRQIGQVFSSANRPSRSRF
jgi:hypothetical protein